MITYTEYEQLLMRIRYLEDVLSDFLTDWGREEALRILAEGSNMRNAFNVRVWNKYGQESVFTSAIFKAVDEMVRKGELKLVKKPYGRRTATHLELAKSEG